MNEIQTKKLNDGTIVLAKIHKGDLRSVAYANRTQAYRKVEELRAAGLVAEVVGRHPFYVRIGS